MFTKDDFNFKPFKNTELNTLLNQLTKHDLIDLANTYEITGVSQLNKSDLVHKISEVYIPSIHNMSRYINERKLDMLLMIKDNEQMYSFSDLDLIDLEALSYMGFIFPVEYNTEFKFVISDDLTNWLNDQKTIKSLKETCKKMTEITSFIFGVTNLYGAYPIHLFINLFKEYNGYMINHEEIEEIVDYLAEYEGGILMNEEYLIHSKLILQFQKLKHNLEIRSHLEYYPFTKEEILIASDRDYVEPSSDYTNLLQFLQKHCESKADAEELAQQIYYNVISGAPMQLSVNAIDQYFEFKNIDQVNQFAQLHQGLHNNCRQWETKGHRPNDLGKSKPSQMRFREHKEPIKSVKSNKVGRNEPCPCGSGRKYKHCCLNN